MMPDHSHEWRQHGWIVMVSPRGWLILSCALCGRRFWFHSDSGANRLETARIVAHRTDCDGQQLAMDVLVEPC